MQGHPLGPPMYIKQTHIRDCYTVICSYVDEQLSDGCQIAKQE